MKNKSCALTVILGIFLSISVFNADTQERLRVWSFTDEVEDIINNYYSRDNPGSRLDYTLIPTENFPGRLNPVLASGRGVPDVFTLEAFFIRDYVESGELLDLTDIYERNRGRLLAYPVEIGTNKGRVYAMSWTTHPGAMFYRRSLAREYLGTDDPSVVQTYFADFDKFIETAALINKRSDGDCVTVASINDLFYVSLGARTQPWVVNGELVIDPAMERFMDISKIISDNHYDGRVGQWSAGWFEGMNDQLRDSKRRRLQVFSYFFPAWGLHYVLKTNAPDTTGDWAMIPGPSPYHWGGIWIAAYRNTQNAEAAKRFIEYIVSDNFLERWAIATGDFISSTNVINRIKSRFPEPFLGGQNQYAAFAEIATNVNGRLVQSTDREIEDFFKEAVTAYVEGEKTKEDALADFRRHVRNALGWN